MIFIRDIWSVRDNWLKAISMALHSMDCRVLGLAGRDARMRSSRL